MVKLTNILIKTIALLLTFIITAASADDLLTTYQSALKNDPQYQASIHSNLAVKENKNQAKALFLPKAAISAFAKKNTIDNRTLDLNYDTSGYTLGLSQPIYNKENTHTFKQSDYSISQSNASLQRAKSDLIVRTATAYFGVLEALDTLDLRKTELKSIGTQLSDIRQQYDVGLVAITDLNESQARHEKAISDKLIAETELDIARARLRIITGLEVGKLKKLKPNLKLNRPAPDNVAAWQEIAEKNNNSIKAQRMAAEIAREEIAKKRAGHYPTLDLIADYGRTNTELPTAADSDGGAIGLELTIPLYQGGAVQSATREAKHRFDESTQRLVETKRNIDNLVRTYYLNAVSDIKLIKAAKQLVKATQTALDASIAGYDTGTRTTIDVLNARSEMFSARLSLAQARYKYLLDNLRLKDAAGILTANDLVTLNNKLK